MKNEKILQLLEKNEIKLLKELLKKEIEGSNWENRDKAARRFFKFKHNDPIFNSFAEKNGYYYMTDLFCAVKTTEQPLTLENKINYDEFVDIEQRYNMSDADEYKNIDIKKVLIDAKIDGYRYTKKETTKDAIYYFKVKNTYFKISLLDKAFSVIDDNKPVTLYYKNKYNPLMIMNEIGQVLIMPIIGACENCKVFEIEV